MCNLRLHVLPGCQGTTAKFSPRARPVQKAVPILAVPVKGVFASNTENMIRCSSMHQHTSIIISPDNMHIIYCSSLTMDAGKVIVGVVGH